MEQDTFVVSARKYRPMGFEQVVGQEHITTTLQNAIDSNQLAQALLFCGPRGVGKTTCARILARQINGFGEEQTNAMNIYELDAASNNSVDDIRNLIDQVRYPPQQGTHKVYIIDEVHMLSNAAFNAFLKTLEEPPPYAVFILATTEKHKVIPTILSRCQIFDFNRIQISDMVRHLQRIAEQEGVEAEEEALNLIAQKADGALRDALSIFDLIVTFSTERKITYQTTIENLHILDYDYYFRVTDALLTQNLPQVMLTFDDILRQGFDGHNFVVGLSEHFRNLLVCKDAATIRLLPVSETVQQRYRQQAEEAPLSFLLTALSLSGDCDLQYKNSKNQRLHVELALMKMAYIQAAVNLARVAQAPPPPNEVEKKKAEPDASAATEAVASAPTNGAMKPTPALSALKNKSTVKIPKLTDSAASSAEALPAETSTTVAPPSQASPLAPAAPVTPISLPKLREAWKAFADERRAAGKDSEYHVLNQPITLADDGRTIPLTLTNILEEDSLNGVKAELLQRLRAQLGNPNITLSATVKREEHQRRPYTPAEKLNYLTDKYPQVRELTKRLELDPDF
ncbi:MAG: DNA polymerase III subunit gamma/tau [Tunicatimonas sp.]